MKNNKKIRFLSLLLLLLSNSLMAADVDRKPVDLRILVDISQQTKTTFPKAQYLGALQLLVDRLPDGSKAGIWSYGKYVNYLVKRADVTPAWRTYAKQQLESVKHVALNRNIVSVVRKASFDSARADNAYRRVILLLSAGEINLYSGAVGNQLERKKLLEDVLPQLRSAGFVVHTIAMSNQADQPLLTSLAKETGGFSFTPENTESFYGAVLALSQWIEPTNYIPLQYDYVAIDAGVTSFTAQLIGINEQIEKVLMAPGGKQISWLQGKYYALVKVDNPELGRWQLPAGLSTLSRIYVEGTQILKPQGLSATYVVGERPTVTLPLASTADSGSADAVEVSLQVQGAETSTQLMQPRIKSILLLRMDFIRGCSRWIAVAACAWLFHQSCI